MLRASFCRESDWKLLNDDQPTVVISEENEFVEVECMNATTSDEAFYRDIFAFVPIKKEVEERCDSFVDNTSSQPTEHLNVMIVGLDALSRLNFQRQMPRSYQFLIERMAAIEMKGYNKVGDNTFPNLVPLLTGLSDDELQHSCLGTSNSSDTTFDDCPFVWNIFRRNGYR